MRKFNLIITELKPVTNELIAVVGNVDLVIEGQSGFPDIDRDTEAQMHPTDLLVDAYHEMTMSAIKLGMKFAIKHRE